MSPLTSVFLLRFALSRVFVAVPTFDQWERPMKLLFPHSGGQLLATPSKSQHTYGLMSSAKSPKKAFLSYHLLDTWFNSSYLEIVLSLIPFERSLTSLYFILPCFLSSTRHWSREKIMPRQEFNRLSVREGLWGSVVILDEQHIIVEIPNTPAKCRVNLCRVSIPGIKTSV